LLLILSEAEDSARFAPFDPFGARCCPGPHRKPVVSPLLKRRFKVVWSECNDPPLLSQRSARSADRIAARRRLRRWWIGRHADDSVSSRSQEKIAALAADIGDGEECCPAVAAE
jgi:hypothetical protein